MDREIRFLCRAHPERCPRLPTCHLQLVYSDSVREVSGVLEVDGIEVDPREWRSPRPRAAERAVG